MRVCPVVWKIGFIVDLKFAPVSLHRLLEQLRGVGIAGFFCFLPQHIAELVLRARPVQGPIGLGKALERLLKVLGRLSE